MKCCREQEPDKSLDEVLSGNRKTDAATMKKRSGFCRHPLIPAEKSSGKCKGERTKRLALPWQEVVGKVSLEFVYLYPPGIPDCCTGRESFGRSCAADSGL